MSASLLRPSIWRGSIGALLMDLIRGLSSLECLQIQIISFGTVCYCNQQHSTGHHRLLRGHPTVAAASYRSRISLDGEVLPTLQIWEVDSFSFATHSLTRLFHYAFSCFTAQKANKVTKSILLQCCYHLLSLSIVLAELFGAC